jgi:hypothetical protein
VFENRLLRGIFGPEAEEVARGWRGLHNEELHNLYASPNSIRVMESRRMRWVGSVARMGEVLNSIQDFRGEIGREEATWKT